MFENYTGKYAQVEYKKIINYLSYMLDVKDLKLWDKEDKILENGVHLRAMNQMYYLYEQYIENNLEKGTKKYISVIS